MTRKLILIGVLVLALAALGTGIAFAAGGVGGGGNVSGPSADRAGEAALASTGGGEVLEVEEADDAGAAYEVEVRTSGGVKEVLLDGDFNVVDTVAGDDDGNENEQNDDEDGEAEAG